MPDEQARSDTPVREARVVELIDPERPGERVVYRPVRPPRQRKRLALVLFSLTCLSTFLVAALRHPFLPGPWTFAEIAQSIRAGGGVWAFFERGLSYSIPLMSILLFHEMGHWLQTRRYGVPASYPYFIPMPLTLFGTMGAVIVQGGGFSNRKALFDIAVSGPLAGLVLAIPFTWYGLLHSDYAVVDAAGLRFGDPLLIKWMVAAVHPDMPAGADVMLNPMLFAGWVGIFITALNLIPIGQLDGGHILYALMGRRANQVAMGLLGAALAYMFVSGNTSYLIIAILLMLFGPQHPPSADDTVPLGFGRHVVGWLTLAFIVIGFTPEPIMM